MPLVLVGGRTIRICHLLWYGCSFGGVILLFLAYDRWQQRTCKGVPVGDLSVNWRGAVLLAVLIVPIEVIHHLLHGPRGAFLVVLLTIILVIGVALKMSASETNGSTFAPGEMTRSSPKADPARKLGF
jgi:hypothetical protein